MNLIFIRRFVSCFIVSYRVYQLDRFTPGICPVEASSRKHIRQISNCRIYPCFLPHFQQRRTLRVENLGFFRALASTDFFAIYIYRLLNLTIYYFHRKSQGAKQRHSFFLTLSWGDNRNLKRKNILNLFRQNFWKNHMLFYTNIQITITVNCW